MLLRQEVPVDILDLTRVRFGLLSVDSRADPSLVELAAKTDFLLAFPITKLVRLISVPLASRIFTLNVHRRITRQ